MMIGYYARLLEITTKLTTYKAGHLFKPLYSSQISIEFATVFELRYLFLKIFENSIVTKIKEHKILGGIIYTRLKIRSDFYPQLFVKNRKFSSTWLRSMVILMFQSLPL